jgi:septum formation protein
LSRYRHKLILASASPRRSEILATLGVEFETRPSAADESSIVVSDDVEFSRRAALLKLEAVLDASSETGDWVLAADTTVCVAGKRLGKPANQGDALEMLSLLQGRDHVVRTGVALGRVGQGVLGTEVVETRVWFREATIDELGRYIVSGESLDKAGAYAVQGLASGFIRRIEGSYTNVVGLPAAEVVELLLTHGALEHWP